MTDPETNGALHGPKDATKDRQLALGAKSKLWGVLRRPPRGSGIGTDLVLFDVNGEDTPH